MFIILLVLYKFSMWKKVIILCTKMLICRFYPHHYAPFISDVSDFKDMEIKFEMGSPFLPFQQLMAVLPAARKELLPEPYQVGLPGTSICFCGRVYSSTLIVTQETSSHKEVPVILGLWVFSMEICLFPFDSSLSINYFIELYSFDI